MKLRVYLTRSSSVLCIPWVKKSFVVHDDVIGMPSSRSVMAVLAYFTKNECKHPASSWSVQQQWQARDLKELRKSRISRRGQMFAHMLFWIYPRVHVLSIHLNLAEARANAVVKCVSDSLETVREIGNVVKNSLPTNTKLDKIRAETTIRIVI